MEQILFGAPVAEQLDEITAKEWITKLEKSMEEKTFFGMCPYITYIYEV